MHLLHLLGTPAQKERYLIPLAAGGVHSCFCMTEPPPGAGSDPMMIRTTAEQRDGTWVINGHKWWSTGADGAAVYLVMAHSNPEVSPREGTTIFLVDADNPGLHVRRRIGGLNHALGGHCEVILEDCEVHDADILGEEGGGYAHAQARLGPARLTHCMRWLGVAQRSLEIAAAYVLKREAFGKKLSEQQAMQWMIADSEMELQASRLMVRHAAWLINRGEKARQESSMAKVFVAETVHRVIDRAIQMCGGTGVSDLTPLSAFYREARAFRIYDGASEVHRMVIARRALKKMAAKAT
jgi:acyl-CoA dehydrogenase